MIIKEEVQHIAKLARLGLKEREIQKFQKELSKILDYIEKLKEVDISKVKPNIHSLPLKNIMREDVIESQKSKLHTPPPASQPLVGLLVKSQKLIDMAPEKKERYFKTKSIL